MKIEDYQLLGDRVLVQAEESEKKTESGIVLPIEDKSKRIFFGKVLAIGTGKWIEDGLGKKKKEFEVEVGDRVMFPRYTGKNVKGLDNAIIVLSQSDILCKVKE